MRQAVNSEIRQSKYRGPLSKSPFYVFQISYQVYKGIRLSNNKILLFSTDMNLLICN